MSSNIASIVNDDFPNPARGSWPATPGTVFENLGISDDLELAGREPVKVLVEVAPIN